MKSAWIRGNARSVYHHTEKNVDKGRNEARGRTIRIAFDDGKVRKIRIDGNADDRGSDEYNLALGQRRSATAKRYLEARGIDASRIEVVSFGKERPLCKEEAETCWQQNRRDGFSITAGAASLGASSR